MRVRRHSHSLPTYYIMIQRKDQRLHRHYNIHTFKSVWIYRRVLMHRVAHRWKVLRMNRLCQQLLRRLQRNLSPLLPLPSPLSLHRSKSMVVVIRMHRRRMEFTHLQRSRLVDKVEQRFIQGIFHPFNNNNNSSHPLVSKRNRTLCHLSRVLILNRNIILSLTLNNPLIHRPILAIPPITLTLHPLWVHQPHLLLMVNPPVQLLKVDRYRAVRTLPTLAHPVYGEESNFVVHCFKSKSNTNQAHLFYSSFSLPTSTVDRFSRCNFVFTTRTKPAIAEMPRLSAQPTRCSCLTDIKFVAGHRRKNYS